MSCRFSDRAKKLILVLFSLSFTGCVSVDLTQIEGLAPGQTYSQSSFEIGTYRFANGGTVTFSGKLDWAMRTMNYDQALEILVSMDRAYDGSYFYLGEIAEAKGLLPAAQTYYQNALVLSDVYATSGCALQHQANIELFKSDIGKYPKYSSVCFGGRLKEVLQKSIARVESKQSGSWQNTVIEYENGDTYIGPTDSSKRPNGLGEITRANGDFYRGQFKNGKPSGHGTMSIQTENTTLYFYGEFAEGNPVEGLLRNPAMNYDMPMRFGNGGFYYLNGDALGSRPAHNNYWFSSGFGQALTSAISQGMTSYLNGTSIMFADDDPLISRVCNTKSTMTAKSARDSGICDE